jgi:hypothetical protein
LRLVLGLVLLDAGSAPVFGWPFEKLAIVHGVLGELPAMGLLAVIVEGRVGVVKFTAACISAFIQLHLPIFFP